MTGYTVHTGASKKFVSGWDRIFGGDDSAEAKSAKTGKSKQAARGKGTAAAKSGSKTRKRKSGK